MRKYCGFLLLLTTFISSSVYAALKEDKINNYFETIKSQPQALYQFLKIMPKGGDLHNHESGATFAENMIKYAVNDGLCVNREDYTVSVNPVCQKKDLLEEAIKDSVFDDELVDAWSMRHFIAGSETGHNHFFATFNKFNLIAKNHRGEILNEISTRAADENELYLELMVTPDGKEASQLGKDIGYNDDFNIMRNHLLAAHLDKIVRDISVAFDQDEAKRNELQYCGTDHAKPACTVHIRYLYQVLREQVPEAVFAQLLAGFEAASKDKRIVGINIVQPEDGFIAMRDYKLHMRMIGFLHAFYPKVHISLHAGELTKDLVPKEGITFHINDAVYVASAERIGHGVDVAFETNSDSLLKTMARKHVLVEINLSSNADILNVTGKSHPLPLYMKYGVPIALSTDDEGVTRDPLTREYQIAVNDFKLTYPTLKNIVRNSIQYAFLQGDSLWQDDMYQIPVNACVRDILGDENPTPACRQFLKKNEKATLQWELEHRFNQFEAQYTK